MLRRGLLLSAALCLLCLPLSWADGYQGPTLPEGWYPISEAELTELETTLERQAETIERQRLTLTQLSTTINQQATTIERLGTSFAEFESVVQAHLTAQAKRVLVWQFVAIGVAVVPTIFLILR